MKKYSEDDLANIKFFFGNRFQPTELTDSEIQELVDLYAKSDFSGMQMKMDYIEGRPWNFRSIIHSPSEEFEKLYVNKREPSALGTGDEVLTREKLEEVQKKLMDKSYKIMGPVMGRLESELLGPMLARTYGLLVKRRLKN